MTFTAFVLGPGASHGDILIEKEQFHVPETDGISIAKFPFVNAFFNSSFFV